MKLTDPLIGLNPEQVQAVDHVGGPLCVVAGAGSGKTKVIERRVLELLRRGTRPERILLLTFTRRAAEEMRERIALVTPVAAEVPALTFHAFAYKVLKRHHQKLGFTSCPNVLDSDDAVRIIRNEFEGVGLKLPRDAQGKNGEKQWGREQNLTPKQALAALSAHANTRRPLEEINGLFAGKLAALLIAYERVKRERNLVDYDDLLALLLKCLKNEPNVVPSDYDAVLVDEFQDTNLIQGEITWLLAPHGNILIVGDPRQAIYGFRGAHDRNILDAMERSDVRVVRLLRNYRSHEGVLNLANNVMLDEGGLVSADGRTGPSPEIQGFETVYDETTFVANRIVRLVRSGVNPNEIAVLTRTNALHTMLQAKLLREKIPFRTFGGGSLLKTAHVRDMLAFARFTLNPSDRLATQRVLELIPGVGEKTAALIADGLGFDAPDVLEHWASTRRNTIGAELHKLSVLLSACWKMTRPLEIMKYLTKHYVPFMQLKYDDVKGRLRDLDSLVEMAGGYDDLQDFIADVLLDASVSMDESRDYVSLSSIHAAKGLEWDHVFLMSADAGTLPHKWALEDAGKAGLEEERRLAYVAVTRARERLSVSFSHFRNEAEAREAQERKPKDENPGRKVSPFFADNPKRSRLRVSAAREQPHQLMH